MKLWLSLFQEFALVLGLGLTCLFIHELGHAVAGYATGQHLTAFVLFSVHPHVGLSGPARAPQQAVSAVAGSGLVLALWFGLLLWPFSARRRATHVWSGFAGAELLGWTLSCLRSLPSTKGDDAAQFLAFSGASPELVLTVCLLVAWIGWQLEYRTGWGWARLPERSSPAQFLRGEHGQV